jgi:hypothetical protein
MILILLFSSLISTQQMSGDSFSPRPLEGANHIFLFPRNKHVVLLPAEGAAIIHYCIPINKTIPSFQNHTWLA